MNPVTRFVQQSHRDMRKLVVSQTNSIKYRAMVAFWMWSISKDLILDQIGTNVFNVFLNMDLWSIQHTQIADAYLAPAKEISMISKKYVFIFVAAALAGCDSPPQSGTSVPLIKNPRVYELAAQSGYPVIVYAFVMNGAAARTIARYCPTISFDEPADKIRSREFAANTKQAGLSKDEVSAVLDSSAFFAKIKSDLDGLQKYYAINGDVSNLCAAGDQAIANNSEIGALLNKT
ncbi:DUF5333 family protein [Sulfitobacter sp. LCG007]